MATPATPSTEQTKVSSLLPEGTAIVCNDADGLCVGKSDPSLLLPSGAYTSLMHLANQLSDCSTSPTPPLVTLETEDARILVKAYDRNTVAFRIPNDIKQASDDQRPQET